MAWTIDLKGEVGQVQWVRLRLPRAFPIAPCSFEVDPALELVLPHVERGGKLCLGLSSVPQDINNPVMAVVRAIEELQQKFLEPLARTGWSEAEFQRERLTYWRYHCTDPRRASRIERRIGIVHFDSTGLREWAFGAVAGYLQAGTKQSRFVRQVVLSGDGDADAVARRHGWAQGTVVKGHALVVRLPEALPWTPTTWPRNRRSLDRLISQATSGETALDQLMNIATATTRRYAQSRKFRTTFTGKQIPLPHAAPQLLVVLIQGSACYGYELRPIVSGREVAIEPFQVQRIDADWCLARDHELAELRRRRSKRVLLLGVGSLGSPIAMLLAKAGVGSLTLVDGEHMEAENTARHTLGLSHINQSKAGQLADEIARAVPGIKITGFSSEASLWLSEHARPEAFDLVVDCTAERRVRNAITLMRQVRLGDTAVAHVWIEPMCSAGHVVLTQPEVPWPVEDPVNDLVNASDLSVDATRVSIPACSAGFHPYGAGDVTQVAAFAVERLLAVLDEPQMESTVWSWVRSKAFFDSLPAKVLTRPIVPANGGKLDVTTVTRPLAHILQPER